MCLCAVIGTPVRGLPRQQAEEYTALYRQWAPPAGYDMKALYFGADGTVVSIVDTQTSAAVYEAALPWTGWEWKVIPVVEPAQMLQIQEKVSTWGEGVLGG
jgi:hypothetical protein